MYPQEVILFDICFDSLKLKENKKTTYLLLLMCVLVINNRQDI